MNDLNDLTLKPASANLPPTTPEDAGRTGTTPGASNLRELIDRAKAERSAPPPEDKKTAGKKGKAKTEAPPSEEFDVTTMLPLVSQGMDLLFARMPNPMPATDKQKESYTSALVRVMNKNIPLLGKWKEELLLIILTITLLIPRMIRKEKPDVRASSPDATIRQDDREPSRKVSTANQRTAKP